MVRRLCNNNTGCKHDEARAAGPARDGRPHVLVVETLADLRDEGAAARGAAHARAMIEQASRGPARGGDGRGRPYLALRKYLSWSAVVLSLREGEFARASGVNTHR